MLKPRKILVIDEEKDIANIIKNGLESHGFEVDAFTNPSSALANFREDIYGLLISDIRMPGMSGIQLVRKIRKIDKKVKILFLTAFEIQEKEWELIHPRFEIHGFIEKPVSIKRLVEVVSQLKLVNSC